MQNSSFNLVQTAAALQKQWKTIFLFVLTSAVVAAVTVFVVTPYYQSTAIVVSANPVLADKARLFNTNIQNLYSYFGSGDDLDRINGVAEMDAGYEKLVDEFSLVTYYNLSDDSLPVLKHKAVIRLRKDLYCRKTEQGQLKIIAWTKDKQLSANLVNRMTAIIHETEAGIWLQNYHRSLEKLKASVAAKESEYKLLGDSLSKIDKDAQLLVIAHMQTLTEQINQYRKTADEFSVAADNPPAVLYVMEAGTPAAKAERPDKLGIILAACLAGFIFSSLLILVNDRKNIV
jgi:LPS O-antigen subunit length determinant protein (WzzB/FepE family)